MNGSFCGSAATLRASIGMVQTRCSPASCLDLSGVQPGHPPWSSQGKDASQGLAYAMIESMDFFTFADNEKWMHHNEKWMHRIELAEEVKRVPIRAASPQTKSSCVNCASMNLYTNNWQLLANFYKLAHIDRERASKIIQDRFKKRQLFVFLLPYFRRGSRKRRRSFYKNGDGALVQVERPERRWGWVVRPEL